MIRSWPKRDNKFSENRLRLAPHFRSNLLSHLGWFHQATKSWLLLLLITSVGRAETLPLSEQKQEKAAVVTEASVKELAAQIQQSKEAVIESDSEKRKILGFLYTITRRMKKITQEKDLLTDELFHVQDNVQNLAKIIATLEKQIQSQRAHLQRRLRALYKLSGEGYLGIVFSQQNSQQVDQALKFLKIVTDADYRLIRSYQENIAIYLDKRRRLKSQVQRLLTIENSIKKQEHLLVKEHRAKTRIVSQLEASGAAALKQIRNIRKQTQGITRSETLRDENMEGILKASFFEKKGQLPHPVAGKVVQDFGLIRGNGFKIQMSHKGWQYSASAGTPVNAVFDGSVAYADSLLGYGNTIIVDHGDHYYTVYGHLHQPKVRVGQDVRKGQTIAEAGSTSRRYGDGIYFEIRHFSESENPRGWLVSRGVQFSVRENNEPVELATLPDLGTQ